MMNMIKILLILAINVSNYSMDYKKFENLLGKHISISKFFTGSDFKTNNYGKKFYINSEQIDDSFLGVPYNFITIIPDENDTIQSITIHFPKLINRQFYDSFIEKYGEPNNIQVIENRKVMSKGTYGDSDFKQHLTKSTFDLREGSFEENPLFIIWKKDSFQINFFFRYEQNKSELTFSFLEELPLIKTKE